jgi:hypothetical protein
MVDSIGNGHAPGLATALMQAKTDRENLEVAVIKKGQDIERQQGEAAVKMIEAASPGKIDIKV